MMQSLWQQWRRLRRLVWPPLRHPAPSSAPSKPPDFAFLLRLLTDGNVRFVVIGGVALHLHGIDHTPHDVDVLIPKEDPANVEANVEAIAQAARAQELRLVRNAKVLTDSTHLTMETASGNVDLLAKGRGIDSFEGVWNRSVLRDIDGREVRVASLDDLIAMKRVANRPKDSQHIVLLQRLQALQQGDLDGSRDFAGRD